MNTIRTTVVALVLVILGFASVAHATESAPEPRPTTRPCQTVDNFLFQGVPDDGGKDCVRQVTRSTMPPLEGNPTLQSAFRNEVWGCPKSWATKEHREVLRLLGNAGFGDKGTAALVARAHTVAVSCREERVDALWEGRRLKE